MSLALKESKNSMKNSVRLIVATAVACLTYSTVFAAPILITSGVVRVGGVHSPGTIELHGTDGVLPFGFDGIIGSDVAIGPRSCFPCALTATTLSLDMTPVGTDLGGNISYGDDRYRTGSLATTSGDMDLFFFGSGVLPPPPPPRTVTATVTAAFQLGMGSHFSPPLSGGPWRTGGAISGGGMATVTLLSEDIGDDRWRWFFRTAEYRFDSPDPTPPVPEPASLILLVSATGGMISANAGLRG